MISATLEQAVATGHVLAAFSALGAGAAVLLVPKGTHRHRVIGTVYVLALLPVNVAALSLHRESTFGVFHALAVVSLVTIAVGLSPLLFGKRSPMVLTTHAYCMTWSYAGLIAAGIGQLFATVLAISGVVIFGRVPSTLDRTLAQR
jgi:uncharacterized membrane protein